MEYIVERDGVRYSEAVDPFGSDRVYTETENKLPEKDEKT